MTAYVIAMVRVDDPETYKKYTALTPALIEEHGGKFLVRGGDIETLEGKTFEDRLVVLEFPSTDAVKTFYESSGYQDAAAFTDGPRRKRSFCSPKVSRRGAGAPDAQVVKSG